MKCFSALSWFGFVLLALPSCETKDTSDGSGGTGNAGGTTSEYVQLESGSEVTFSCPDEVEGLHYEVTAAICRIWDGGVWAEVSFGNTELRVHVANDALGIYQTGQNTSTRVLANTSCAASSIRNRTPCTIELAEYTRAENPVDGMAGASGTAVEVGSAVTMLVDCPEGLSIDRGDDWSPLPVSLEPKKFSIYAEDCEVTW